MTSTTCLLIALILSASDLRGAPGPIETALIEQITGVKGVYNETENVFKISVPRTDVKVTVDQWAMPPFMGLTSWAAFTPGQKRDVMVMGDLVLFQDEVNPVMSVAFANGLDVTALHNHFFYDEPKVYFMHITGEGPLDKLAEAVRRSFDRVKEIRAARPQPATGFGGAPIPGTNSITSEPIEGILGVKGQSKDGMVKLIVGRQARMACGCDAGKDMGVNTWAAFAGTDQNAVVDGDFAVQEKELPRVLRALRHFDINIVAIHHHMVGENPRLLFLHYWGRGKSAALAKGIRTALDAQH
jgi:hypothetical protein